MKDSVVRQTIVSSVDCCIAKDSSETRPLARAKCNVRVYCTKVGEVADDTKCDVSCACSSTKRSLYM